MAKTTRKKCSVKASAAKPSGNPPTGDKTFGTETAICFYAIEDGDDTEKGEEAEILFVTTKASQQLSNKENKQESLSSKLNPHVN